MLLRFHGLILAFPCLLAAASSQLASASKSAMVVVDDVDESHHHQLLDSLAANIQNLRAECDAWAMEGRCSLPARANFMRHHCPISCGISSQNLTSVVRTSLDYKPATKEEETRKRSNNRAVQTVFGRHRERFDWKKMVDVAGGDIGVPQEMPHSIPLETRQAMFERIREAQDYFNDIIMLDDFYRPVRDLCRNRDERCALWATQGECEANPEFMNRQCAPVCYTCENLHTSTKCPIDPNMKNAWYPGDLNRMFERIVDENVKGYNITTLSRPPSRNDTIEQASSADSNNDIVDTTDGEEESEVLSGPWIITIDDFISPEEASTLIYLGANRGYEKSTDSGDVLEDGSFGEEVSKERTSTNAWCQDECLQHNVTRAVVARIEELIQIPEVNSESFQMLRYEPGQFYGVHHDYIWGQERKAEGARILTVFLYLNDVEEGGATNFSELDLAVAPKQGRVLIWPSVLDEDPHSIDLRTKHEAKKVIKGIKYGANSWYHIRNNQIPLDMGCA